MSARSTITERAMSMLSGGPKVGAGFPGGKIPLAPQTSNKNLRYIQQKQQADFFKQTDYINEQQAQHLSRRTQHQLLLTTVYNKLVLLHLAPGVSNTIVKLYEVDPNFIYKNQQSITVKTFNSSN